MDDNGYREPLEETDKALVDAVATYYQVVREQARDGSAVALVTVSDLPTNTAGLVLLTPLEGPEINGQTVLRIYRRICAVLDRRSAYHHHETVRRGQ